MIKRETIKQAVDAIGRRDPEIGYALDEMLAAGKIDVPGPDQNPILGADFYFLFNGYKARVSRFLYINKGNIPIEERLLLKFGELRKKQELLEKGEPVDTPKAARVIRNAGLSFMVAHEIDYAIERVRNQIEKNGDAPAAAEDRLPAADVPIEVLFATPDPAARNRRLILFLEALKQDQAEEGPAADSRRLKVFYQGILGDGAPAVFVQFPYTMNSLLQVADINIEFFHVRFFLNRLIQNQWQHLYACQAENKIVGLVYLTFKGQMFHHNLEIKFIAAARSEPAGAKMQAALPPLRGVGTFLVAGAWLQWRTRLREAREILLDSEIGARRFYDALGFSPRGISEYILGTPRPYLLAAIVRMANSSPGIDPQVYHEIGKVMQKQVKSLRRRPKTEKGQAERDAVLEAAGEFMKAAADAEARAALLRLFHKYRKKIPESAEFLRSYAADRAEAQMESSGRAAGSHH